jgi:hypothetical protein
MKRKIKWKEVKNMSIQIRNRIKNSSDEVLKQIVENQKLRNKGEAIDFLCEQYLNSERIRVSEDRITNAVIKGLLAQLQPIRVRTGYIDKEMKIVLDLLNHIMLEGRFDKDELYDTVDWQSRAYRLSNERVQKQIDYFSQKKNNRSIDEGIE